MVPAAVTGRVVSDVAKLLDEGDTIIDGGNSYYRDDIARAAELADEGDPLRRRRHLGRRLRARARLLPDDRRGGRGRRAARADLRHHRARRRRGPAHTRADRAPSPRPSAATCTAARTAPGTSSRWCTTGSSTASWPPTPRAWTSSRTPTSGCASAPATPRRRRSSIPSTTATTSTRPRSPRCGGAAASIGSWLLDLTARRRCTTSADLEEFSGRVSDSGEGRWTSIAAIEEGVPAYVLTAAVYERFSSRGEGTYANRVLSAMRKEFGGHVELPAQK